MRVCVHVRVYKFYKNNGKLDEPSEQNLLDKNKRRKKNRNLKSIIFIYIILNKWSYDSFFQNMYGYKLITMVTHG